MNTVANWEELNAKQAKEMVEYKNEYQKSFIQFQADQKALRSNMQGGEANLPDEVKEAFARNEGAFKNEWGLVYGRRAKALGFQHQKEIDDFLNRKIEIDKQKERFVNTPEKEMTH